MNQNGGLKDKETLQIDPDHFCQFLTVIMDYIIPCIIMMLKEEDNKGTMKNTLGT